MVLFPWQFTGVYGPTIRSAKPCFWDMLKRIGEAFQGPWLVMSDFNYITGQHEKKRGRPFASSRSGGFKHMIDDSA